MSSWRGCIAADQSRSASHQHDKVPPKVNKSTRLTDRGGMMMDDETDSGLPCVLNVPGPLL